MRKIQGHKRCRLGVALIGAAVTALPAAGQEATAGSNWSGFYVGVQSGFGTVEVRSNGPGGSTVIENGDGIPFGVHAGFNHDFGRFVLGAEVQYDAGTLAFDQLPAGNAIEGQAALKLRAGADFDRVLIYGVAGVGWANIETTSNDLSMTGLLYGLGLEYRLTERFTAGAELRQHHLTSVRTGAVVTTEPITDIRMLELRASYHF